MSFTRSTLDAIVEQAAQAVVLRRPPSATYRWQFNRHFSFGMATELAGYLRDLGVSTCYASPILQARAGSQHGYDICDHSRINPDLGDLAGFCRLTDALRQSGLGLLLDIVPNHMGIGEVANRWWTDVLENGPSSRYAKFFDIDWQPLKPELRNKVLLPILGDQYGIVLENQELQVVYEDGAFWLTYYEHRFPIAPRSFLVLLEPALEALQARLGETHEAVLELLSIMTSLENLPAQAERRPARIAVREREKEVVKRRIVQLRDNYPAFAEALDRAIATINGRGGDPASFDALDRLLDRQAYRLAYWRVAAEEINYRRFFDVNDLIALRMEDPEVFEETHHLIFDLIREGRIDGLRIDHPDGLRDPEAYLHHLQERATIEIVRPTIDRLARDAGIDPDELVQAVAKILPEARLHARSPLWRPLYLVAEKILMKGEPLPEGWPVHGTTGYEFANAVNGLFVDPASRKLFDSIYSGFIDQRVHLRNLVNSSKKMIMLVSLASEINLLTAQLNRISEKNRRSRDFTVNSLTFALREVIAALPVYRTYTVADRGTVAERDRAYIESALTEAKRRNPRTAAAVFDFIGDILLLKRPPGLTDADWEEVGSFVMKFQQTTGPVMAKGFEDTVFYVYNRLVSLNEVGGDLEQFGLPVADFHQLNAERRERWPDSLIATATHDTKRGEDVRARIDVLGELPVEWRESLRRWSDINRRHKIGVDGQAAPDRNEEYLLYQTLIGSWPFEPVDAAEFATYRERIKEYMLKAIKEAKVNTSWVNPNEGWDAAMRAFVDAILADPEPSPFVADFRGLHQKTAFHGVFNSLAQTLLKLTSPGVPDIYQGTELWDLSLVDPDNRRPVDYGRRMKYLAEIQAQIAAAEGAPVDYARELVESAADGRVKLFLIHRVLTFRRQHPDLFARGDYRPIEATGSRAPHAIAFARGGAGSAVIAVAPRLTVNLTRGNLVPPLGPEIWQDTRLPVPDSVAAGAYRDVLTGRTVQAVPAEGGPAIRLADVLTDFPVALLTTVKPE